MMEKALRLVWTSPLAAAMLLGCGGRSDVAPPPEYPPIEQAEPMAATPAEPMEPAEPPPPPPPPPVQGVAGERTPNERQPPKIKIAAPRNNQAIRGNVMLRIRLKDWELGEAPGKHVHVIVDNHPYIAVRDVSKPINLNELVQDKLAKELEPGTHSVRVFPSRHNHESVKEGTPFDMVVFHYKKRDKTFKLNPQKPLLTYSRPKGCYETSKAQRVLLDFYLTNVDGEELGEDDGPAIKYTVDGVTGEAEQWVPHYIENLQPGKHTVRLQLMDGDGELVEGRYNDTSRTITVADACPKPVKKKKAEEAEEPGANGKKMGHKMGEAKGKKGGKKE